MIFGFISYPVLSYQLWPAECATAAYNKGKILEQLMYEISTNIDKFFVLHLFEIHFFMALNVLNETKRGKTEL